MEADYVKVMGGPSGEYTTETISIVNIYIAAVKSGVTTRSGMLNFINGYKGETVAGTKLSFDRNGDNNGAAAITGFVVKGGKIVPIEVVK
jgi:branched-chain amino acid transport system substrate-binding protein